MVDHREGGPLPDVGDADGLILLQPGCTMRIFNRDGSEAEMCGNGLRCFIQFLIDLGIEQEIYHVQTLSGKLTGWAEEGEIVVTLPDPTAIREMTVDGHLFYFLTVGVPHAVCFDPIEDFEAFGKHYVAHPAFGLAGTNVNYVSDEGDLLYVRTFERGVGKETGSCGTGSAASFIASKRPSPQKILTYSGEILTLTHSPLTLRGKVTILS